MFPSLPSAPRTGPGPPHVGVATPQTPGACPCSEAGGPLAPALQSPAEDRGRQCRGFALRPRPPFCLLSRKKVESELWISSAWQQVFICSVFSACHRRVSLLASSSHPPGLCYPLGTTGLWVLFRGTHLLTPPLRGHVLGSGHSGDGGHGDRGAQGGRERPRFCLTGWVRVTAL